MKLINSRLNLLFDKWFRDNLSNEQKDIYYKYMRERFSGYRDEEIIRAIVHLFGTKIEDVTK